MLLMKQTAWTLLVTLYMYGITDRLLDYQRNQFTAYELSILLVPLFCLLLTLFIRPKT